MKIPHLKIRKGDRVKVIAGRSKGKVGDVLRVLPTEQRVVVQGVNVIKRHTKPGRADSGGIIEREAAIHVSNVMLVNPATGKGDRVGFKFLEAQGTTPARKVRFFKSNGEVVDV